jgi:VanZ family protein
VLIDDDAIDLYRTIVAMLLSTTMLLLLDEEKQYYMPRDSSLILVVVASLQELFVVGLDYFYRFGAIDLLGVAADVNTYREVLCVCICPLRNRSML